MKKILIATPCLNQKVDAYFVDSLCESIRLGMKENFYIKCTFLANESILPMARNELINLAYVQDYDGMVFIDDDEKWDPAVLIKILKSNKDVITVPVVNKQDINVSYNVFFKDNKNLEIDPIDGYIKAIKTGTGFLKLSRKAISDLWNSNSEVFFRNKTLKHVFDYGIINGDFVGEDVNLSMKLQELGYTIWVFPEYTVEHIGNKIYTGNFKKSFNL